MNQIVRYNNKDPVAHFFMSKVKRIDYLRKASSQLLEEMSFHAEVKLFEYNQVIFKPGETCPGIYFVVRGVIEVYTIQGEETVVLDYLGKGSVIG